MRRRLVTMALGTALLAIAGEAHTQDTIDVRAAPTGERTANVVRGMAEWNALPLPAIPDVLSGECRVLGEKGGQMRHVTLAFPSRADLRVSHALMYGEGDVLLRYMRHHYPPGSSGFTGNADNTLQVDYQQGFALKIHRVEGVSTGARITLAEFESSQEFGIATAAMLGVLQLCAP